MITLICVGSLKEGFFREAVGEYEKRLLGYTKMAILSVKDEREPDRASPKEQNRVREAEGNRMLALLSKRKEGAFVVALDIKGRMLDSVALSSAIGEWETKGRGEVVFLIGGSLGLSDAVLSRADYRLSFSALTFPHQLMRVLLLEQVYRAYRIRMGEPYHK